MLVARIIDEASPNETAAARLHTEEISLFPLEFAKEPRSGGEPGAPADAMKAATRGC